MDRFLEERASCVSVHHVCRNGILLAWLPPFYSATITSQFSMLLPSHTFISYAFLLHFKSFALVSSLKAPYGYVRMYHSRIGRKTPRDPSWPPQRSPTQHRSTSACPRREGSFLELFCGGLSKSFLWSYVLCIQRLVFMRLCIIANPNARRRFARHRSLTRQISPPAQPHDLYPFGGWTR
jgi:hypothetical protein